MKELVYFRLYNIEKDGKKTCKSKITIIKNIIEKLYRYKYKIMEKYNFIENEDYNTYVIYGDSRLHSKKILYKLNKKIRRILEKRNNIKIVLSNQIKELLKENYEIEGLKEIQYVYKSNHENKDLYIEYINEIIRSVIKSREEIPEEQSIYILINSSSKLQIVNKVIQNYKMINIVTNNVQQFKRFEKMAEENFELVSVLNNKRKSLSRAEYIINIDFSEEQLYAYCINRDAVIFNINNIKIKNLKNFDGFIINNFNISCKSEFDFKDEYISNKDNSERILNYIEKCEYKLEGNNGEIKFKKRPKPRNCKD